MDSIEKCLKCCMWAINVAVGAMLIVHCRQLAEATATHIAKVIYIDVEEPIDPGAPCRGFL